MTRKPPAPVVVRNGNAPPRRAITTHEFVKRLAIWSGAAVTTLTLLGMIYTWGLSAIFKPAVDELVQGERQARVAEAAAERAARASADSSLAAQISAINQDRAILMMIVETPPGPERGKLVELFRSSMKR